MATLLIKYTPSVLHTSYGNACIYVCQQSNLGAWIPIAGMIKSSFPHVGMHIKYLWLILLW